MVKWILSGGLVPPMLLVCGVFFFLYLRGAPLCAPRRMLAALRAGGGSGVSPFRALCEALAGTLGVGNVVGVANAIAVGGAGSIFWMWVSATFAMILKYAEVLLAVAHRRARGDGSYHGGAYYYIKDHFFSRGYGRIGLFLGAVFASFMILDALCMGCMIQVRAVTSSMQEVKTLPAWSIALLLLVLTLPPLLRGKHGISALTKYLVPVMSAGYILLSLAVLVLRWDGLGDAVRGIFSSALSPASMGGGVLGFLTSRALRVGTMRGILSNEAGCGTSPTAHASASVDSPATQGVWGILEVFVDTYLLCTLTALALLVSLPDGVCAGRDAMGTVLRAYSLVLGDWAGLFLAAAVFFFGYATLLCWGGYGMEALSFLSPSPRWRRAYLVLFSACIFLGAYATGEGAWVLSDLALCALTTINLCVLVLMRREVRERTRAWRTP